jgi:hypothetical protein
VKPYTEQDLLKKDFLTFLKILKESEKEETAAVARMEKSSG